MPSKKPASLKNIRNCRHIKVTGVQCGAPAMRGEQFCYFHQRMLRGVKTPPNVRLHPIALIEDEESIQASLMEVINALARNHIDLRRADLLLKALYIAVKNSHRARFNVNNSQMVREVPDYPAAPKPAAKPVSKEQALTERTAENTALQVMARALTTIPAPAAATTSPAIATATASVTPPSQEKVKQEKAVQEKVAPPAAKVPAPSKHALQLWEGTMKKAATIAANPVSATPSAKNNFTPDPTTRKPAARAGFPSTAKQVAVNQSKRRT